MQDVSQKTGKERNPSFEVRLLIVLVMLMLVVILPATWFMTGLTRIMDFDDDRWTESADPSEVLRQPTLEPFLTTASRLNVSYWRPKSDTLVFTFETSAPTSGAFWKGVSEALVQTTWFQVAGNEDERWYENSHSRETMQSLGEPMGQSEQLRIHFSSPNHIAASYFRSFSFDEYPQFRFERGVAPNDAERALARYRIAAGQKTARVSAQHDGGFRAANASGSPAADTELSSKEIVGELIGGVNKLAKPAQPMPEAGSWQIPSDGRAEPATILNQHADVLVVVVDSGTVFSSVECINLKTSEHTFKRISVEKPQKLTIRAARAETVLTRGCSGASGHFGYRRATWDPR